MTGIADAAAPEPTEGSEVDVRLHGWTHGGEAVGRLPNGMACFVAYGLPGETVRVRIHTLKKRWARADLVAVVEPSPHRTDPPCPEFGPGRCGGCQLQHAMPSHQLELKARVLTEQLRRIGKVAHPPDVVVEPIGADWPAHYRSWARMAVDRQGQLGFRQLQSHEVHPVEQCLLLDTDTQTLRGAAGDGWAGVEEVSITTGDDGGFLTITPGPGGVPGAPDGPFGVGLHGAGGIATLREPDKVTITVAGRRLQLSAGAFFQSGPAAATALVEAVVAAADVGPGDVVADLYAGIGIFATALADAGARVIAVESHPVAAADAVVNLSQSAAEVLDIPVEHAVQGAVGEVDVVVLDPPRTGAGAEVCTRLAHLASRRIIYVACDPAALATDTKTLHAHGWRLDELRAFDTFGHTAHVEAVATFAPTDGREEAR